MKLISRQSFEGERALFALHDARIEAVEFLPGESPLKHCADIEVSACEFMAKYPLWHTERVCIEKSHFTAGSRAAVWYTRHVRMTDCTIDAPKMFRRVEHLMLENCSFGDAAETLWACRDVSLRKVTMKNGDYLFMNSADLQIEDFTLQGNYAFDGAKNVVIRRAHLDSKDAFWNSENITVFDSVLDGEYLGWHSKNLRLVNCRILGTQPLCFATNLILENCVMDAGADLAFEHSTVQAEIAGDIHSIKNPAGGAIRARHIGTLILDEHCRNPGACEIITGDTIAV